MLSTTAEYALRAVLYIAQHEAAGPVRVPDVAQAVRLPRNYLSKILHQLTRDGILRSSRGKGGGFQLAKSPAAISLLDIVRHYERFEARRTCLLGRARCSDTSACIVHSRWKAVSEHLAAFFRDTTVADLQDSPSLT